MDKILLGVAASTHPVAVKKALVSKLITSASKPLPEDQVMSIFHLSSRWIIEAEDEFQREMGDQVFTAWSKYNQTVMEQFFTHQFLIGVIGGDVANPQGVVSFIHRCFKMLHNRESASKIVQSLTITLAKESKDTSSLAELSRLLIAFPDCLPKGDFIKTLCITIIQSMSKTKMPSTEEVKSSLEDVAQIGLLLQGMWRDNLTAIIPSLTAIFGLISKVDETNEAASPSVALGALVQRVPVEMIKTVTESVAKDRGIPDGHMTAALTRMIDWLSWPGVRNIDRWIVGFLQNLAKAQKFTILINVTLATVEKVFVRLCFPIARDSALPVLTHMLLSFQHSPEAFHKIAGHIPELLKRLKDENSASSQDCEKEIAELTYCLMYQHAGYPDVYEPVLAALKHIPRPVDDVIVERLKQSAWTSQGEAAAQSLSFRFAPRSDTGKTGLVNLGNTCYMNSVIQALYMTCGFRDEVLSATVYNKKAVLGTLQKTFAFQSHTQRAAYSPRDFLKASRPPWFNPGSQQDCSEFLKYLLDRLDGEEKAIRKYEQTVADYHSRQQQEHLKRSQLPPDEGTGERSNGVVASAKKVLKTRPKELPLKDSKGEEAVKPPLELAGYVLVSKSDDESAKGDEEKELGAASHESAKGDEEKEVKELGAASQAGDASNEIQKSTIVEKYFGGKSTTHIKCHKCNCVSSRMETFFDLPLAFPESNGKSMLGGESNVEREQVESEKLSSSNAGGSVRSPDVPMVTIRQPSQENVVFGPILPPGFNTTEGVVYGPHLPPPNWSEGAMTETSQTTVQEMLSHFLTPEVLTGENKYHCENCQSLQDAEKSIEIVKSPHILVLSLMRFSYDVKTQRRCKILTDVKFPQVLNMQMQYEEDDSMEIECENKQCDNEKPTHLPPCMKKVRTNSSGGSSSQPQIRNTRQERKYVLTAVIVHSGLSSESGHYYCYARHSEDLTRRSKPSKPKSTEDKVPAKSGDEDSKQEDEDPLPDRWYLFNDSRVSFSSYESFGNVTKRFPKDTAYLLFYQQMPGYGDDEVEKQELESGIRIREKPLSKDLQEAVTKDNATYLQEREIEARTMALKTSTPQTTAGFNFRNFNDRNDPPGGCGSGGGGGFGSPRLVF